jgi:hypothetical protein
MSGFCPGTSANVSQFTPKAEWPRAHPIMGLGRGRWGASQKYTDLQVEASLQLSIYSYAKSMNGLADQEDLRLRFDVLTKTKQPELHRYWTTRDRAANRRLFRLVVEVLHAIEAGVFHPNPGWACKDCPFRSRCWAWG